MTDAVPESAVRDWPEGAPRTGSAVQDWPDDSRSDSRMIRRRRPDASRGPARTGAHRRMVRPGQMSASPGIAR